MQNAVTINNVKQLTYVYMTYVQADIMYFTEATDVFLPETGGMRHLEQVQKASKTVYE